MNAGKIGLKKGIHLVSKRVPPTPIPESPMLPKVKKEKANEAIYTFVAVDETGKPTEVPPIIPETALETERFEGALRRKQLSLVLAGKMKPNEATELRALFMKE